jgi:hypothetical protein
MCISRNIGCAAAIAAVLVPAAAVAGPLTIVETSFPEVNCVFNPGCTITVTDSVGKIGLGTDSGAVRLQSRTFTGAAGTPAAGKTGYMYRVDLTQGKGWVDCLVGLVVSFGPVLKLPYKKGSPAADVFVGTKGGLGSVSLKSAEQDGNVITFTFSKYLCLGETTFFFGLTSDKAPKAIAVGVFGIGVPPYLQVDARAPGN